MIQRYDELRLQCFRSYAPTGAGPYFYTVTNACTAHTAFRTQRAVETWLARRGLTLADPVPAPGDEWYSLRVHGAYSTAMHLAPTALDDLIGWATRRMSNGHWTRAIITADPATGEHTEHYLNVNVPTRIVYHHQQSNTLEDAGQL